jgi:hypothetical protein
MLAIDGIHKWNTALIHGNMLKTRFFMDRLFPINNKKDEEYNLLGYDAV